VERRPLRTMLGRANGGPADARLRACERERAPSALCCRPDGGMTGEAAWSSRSFAYRLRSKASAIRASNSFFTSFFGSGLSTGKCSEPLVFVYPSVSSASRGITEPLCGR
jgi:hypothetical protein